MWRSIGIIFAWTSRVSVAVVCRVPVILNRAICCTFFEFFGCPCQPPGGFVCSIVMNGGC